MAAVGSLTGELLDSMKFDKLTLVCGPLAQLAEHLTFNQGVAGSRPARPTKAGRPSLSRNFKKNQGVRTLGQPTP